MLLSALPPQNPLSNPTPPPHYPPTLLFSPAIFYKAAATSTIHASSHRLPLLTLTNAAATSSTTLRHVSGTCSDDDGDGDGDSMVTSASAVAAAIRNASTSPVEFIQTIEKDDGKNRGLVLPSVDFQRLCLEQLELFRRIVHPDSVLSVYVRPAGSYVMDRLELQRVILHPRVNATDLVILIGNFSIPAGLRIAEAALSRQEAELLPELGAVVFPMLKHPFIVGFLVAELPSTTWDKGGLNVKGWPAQEETFPLPPSTDLKSLNIKTSSDHSFEMLKFTAEQRLNAINISRSLAMAYVMDQKSILLQQSTWQNNIRMSNLVEQIRGSLSSIRTLSKMLSVQIRKSEISYDIVQDILEQGDCLSDTLKGLQDVVSLTKANIMRYSEETLKRMPKSTHPDHESVRSQLSDNLSQKLESFSLKSKDLEMPMPPIALAPLRQEGIRPCNISDVLVDLVGAVVPLAHEQKRAVLLSEVPRSLQVPIEEPALRQALGNLIEGALLRIQAGGKVEIIASGAPAGGALVIIDDDGLDMHYMTQMHSLAPFGADLFSEDRVEDNMTWNFVAGLTVSREILESYGCVVRVISPRVTDAAIGTGGTRIELWFPSFSASSVVDGPSHEA
ncbi:chloroplast sensor kinase, chloroplastic [Solanum tuberosum]|uniref:CSK (CHLOROPLAST SENSOR KINASE); ATP binding / kinase n=2 Tax=Solanum tuberosum TaxID=4113 RepID=M1BLI9_SOLTU|nr:PREDICTED: chloroplast sensor kinase, chloroplastic [Solanum tuberosum]